MAICKWHFIWPIHYIEIRYSFSSIFRSSRVTFPSLEFPNKKISHFFSFFVILYFQSKAIIIILLTWTTIYWLKPVVEFYFLFFFFSFLIDFSFIVTSFEMHRIEFTRFGLRFAKEQHKVPLNLIDEFKSWSHLFHRRDLIKTPTISH